MKLSIIVATYNHFLYIEEALLSFLKQKVNFKFEIIVHDDASTDGTQDIIRKYQAMYPDIIVPVYQVQNQYSQGKDISQFIVPHIRGDYVALCEGDDFWNNIEKLQLQVNFLDSNDQYGLVFHRVNVVDSNSSTTGKFLGLQNNKNQEVKMSDSIMGGVVHISSMMLRKELYTMDRPSWMRNTMHGDYVLVLLCAINSKIYYISKAMSSYRVGVKNSAMSIFNGKGKKKLTIQYYQNRIKTIQLANEYYEYKYDSSLQPVILHYQTIVLILSNKVNISARKVYRKYIRENSIKSFIKIVLLNKMLVLSKTLYYFKKSRKKGES